MATERRTERGEIRIGLILSLIVLVAAIYFAMKVIPVMYHTYAFEKEVGDIAMSAAGQRSRGLSKIRDAVIQAADDHGLKEDLLRTAGERHIEPVRVERGTSELVIHVELVKPIDLMVTTWNWQVDHTERRTLY
jgi:hypothetical protein